MTHISEHVPLADRVEPGCQVASASVAIERLMSAGIGITVRAIGGSPAAASLTVVQWRALVIAASREGPRVGELAAHLGVSVPSASRLIRRLEVRGLVVTARAEGDRRVTIVSLTKAGRALVDDVIARRRDLIDRAIHDWPRRRELVGTVVIEELAARVSEFA